MINLLLCSFCKKDVECIEYLLLQCAIIEGFWKAFTSWLTKQNISLQALTLVNILFGVFNENEDNIILNHLILMAKFYIYKCKLNGTNPSLKVFIAKNKTVYQIELLKH